MIYQRDCNEYYLKLIHLMSDDSIWLSLYEKRILDNKVISLVKFLEKLKEKSDKY